MCIHTQAFGPGTVSAVVGEESSFSIITRDVNGNQRSIDGAATTAEDMLSGVLLLVTDVGHGGGNPQVLVFIH
jgi:hypothetical protein